MDGKGQLSLPELPVPEGQKLTEEERQALQSMLYKCLRIGAAREAMLAAERLARAVGW